MIDMSFHISRTFIQNHRELTFVYGHDVQGKGILGQPWAAHGEPNAFPVPTMYKFCPSGQVLFVDSRIEEWMGYIDKAVEKIPLDKPVIVLPRIGRGCSRLFEVGPHTYKYLMKVLYTIEHKNVNWVR